MTTDISPAGRVSVAQVKAAIEAGTVQVVDVRPSFDYAGGRIPGSLSLPNRAIATRADLLDKNKRTLFLSEDGTQSETAMEIARNLGFKDFANIDGGYNAWLDAGYPVDTIDQET